MVKNKGKKKNSNDEGLVAGVFGFLLSLMGLLLAFNLGTDNLYLFILFIIMIAVGIILVAKALSK